MLGPVTVDGHGQLSRRLLMRQWTTSGFTIAADDTVAAGIDGEAAQLRAPLRFSTRPGALRVRIAPHHPGASPSALEPDRPWQAVGSLATFVVRGAPASVA